MKNPREKHENAKKEEKRSFSVFLFGGLFIRGVLWEPDDAVGFCTMPYERPSLLFQKISRFSSFL
jgi:hypothetical protein